MLNLRSSVSSLVCSTALLSSTMALAAPPPRPGQSPGGGASAVSPEASEANVAGESAETSDATSSVPTTLVSDGSSFEINDLGMKINPPTGWEIITNTGSVSLLLQEPKGPVEYDKTMYQRNITVAASHRASPIDEKRADDLKSQLQASFGKDTSASDFQVLEHKFFDYRGKNDGLLVYSSLKIGEEPMMQMHILVSGGEKQFLLTYTDMASRFNDQVDKGFETAWNSMVSIEVSGQAPHRIEGYYKYFALAGGIGFLGLTLFLLRRKAAKQDFDSEANALEESDEAGSLTHSLIATLAHGWKIAGSKGAASDDFEFHSQTPKTHKPAFVSNY